jgi:hypothetical protein
MDELFSSPAVAGFLAGQGLREREQSLLRTIVSIEWSQFDRVQNMSSRASCQDDARRFFVFRVAQYAAFPSAMLSPLCDELERSEREGRNLVQEKYARMMERTDPESFARDWKLRLGPLSPVKRGVLDELGELMRGYVRAAARGLPVSHGHARPDVSADGRISSVDYLLAELSSYSLGALFLLKDALSCGSRDASNPVEKAYELAVCLSALMEET